MTNETDIKFFPDVLGATEYGGWEINEWSQLVRDGRPGDLYLQVHDSTGNWKEIKVRWDGKKIQLPVGQTA